MARPHYLPLKLHAAADDARGHIFLCLQARSFRLQTSWGAPSAKAAPRVPELAPSALPSSVPGCDPFKRLSLCEARYVAKQAQQERSWRSADGAPCLTSAHSGRSGGWAEKGSELACPLLSERFCAVERRASWQGAPGCTGPLALHLATLRARLDGVSLPCPTSHVTVPFPHGGVPCPLDVAVFKLSGGAVYLG